MELEPQFFWDNFSWFRISSLSSKCCLENRVCVCVCVCLCVCVCVCVCARTCARTGDTRNMGRVPWTESWLIRHCFGSPCQPANALLEPWPWFLWFFYGFVFSTWTNSPLIRPHSERFNAKFFPVVFQVYFQENKYLPYLNECESYVVSMLKPMVREMPAFAELLWSPLPPLSPPPSCSPLR